MSNTTTTTTDIDEFIDGYATALLWSDCDDEISDLHSDGLDAFTHDALNVIRRDCNAFMAANAVDLRAAVGHGDAYSMSSAGHDFALTRNGHGAGFWDRGLGEVGERLSTASAAFGEINVFPLDINVVDFI